MTYDNWVLWARTISPPPEDVRIHLASGDIQFIHRLTDGQEHVYQIGDPLGMVITPAMLDTLKQHLESAVCQLSVQTSTVPALTTMPEDSIVPSDVPGLSVQENLK